jgi:hypothetical protein
MSIIIFYLSTIIIKCVSVCVCVCLCVCVCVCVVCVQHDAGHKHSMKVSYNKSSKSNENTWGFKYCSSYSQKQLSFPLNY